MRHVFLLRAVNVGGFKVPMAELRELARELGATEVSTYIASGNLLCIPPADPESYARDLEQGIKDRWGGFREVVIRTADQLTAALDAHPFEVSNPAHHFIHALIAQPSDDAPSRLAEFDGPEQAQLIGMDVHLRYPHGAGSSRLTATKLARLVGAQGTSRNVNTVRKLIELARVGTS